MNQLETAAKIIELTEQLETLRSKNSDDLTKIVEVFGEISILSARLSRSVLKGEAEFILSDEETGETLNVHAKVGAYGLYIGADGYGDLTSADGGEFLLLDWFNSKFRTLIWSDINLEEPTHTILLEDAKLSNRRDQ